MSKIEDTIRMRAEWNARAGLKDVSDLNNAIRAGRIGDIIRTTEALQEKHLAKIAEEIAARESVRVVLLAGPSSSGKTSTSKRLAVQLMTCLKRPVALSMDNWFVNREDTPLDENGEKDFESIYSLDLAQFNRDLQDLIDGKEVKLPTYNFQLGEREYRGDTLRLEPDNILIVEGIHALNPVLTADIAPECKYLVYASALTALRLDENTRISTSDNRLLRRMCRDYVTRGCSAEDTLSRWPSVRRGEEKWIFPYQENADAIFNTAMVYEITALYPKAVKILSEVPVDSPAMPEAQRLLHFLTYFVPIPDKEIPMNSLLREFIGGSVFDVG
ncbi:MAG: nucleoside kinase [Bacteroidales bacterium]|nr:nucleoside kinase [Candidatus Liminaster caballi]